MYLEPITIAYLAMFALIALWAIILAVRWQSLPRFAGQVYDSNTEKGLLDARIDREGYIQAYTRAEAPRSGAWRCATSAVCLLLLPILVSFFGGLLQGIWDNLGVGFGPYGLGQIAQDFALFLLIMGVYAGILYVVTRYYYHRRPPSLNEEVTRLKQEAGL
jgi:hypothetical protein